MVVTTPGPLPLWIYRSSSKYEDLHGPLPDVVETRGRFLVPQPHTPVDTGLDVGLPEKLRDGLERALFNQRLRVHDYGLEAAEAWPHRHTPPHIRQEYADRLKALRDKRESYVSPDDDSDGPAPWSPQSPQSPQTRTPPSSASSTRSLTRNTPPKVDKSKWIYPGIWYGWDDPEELTLPKIQPFEMAKSEFPRIPKRRLSETSNGADDGTGDADDESRPSKRRKREATLKDVRSIRTPQRQRDARLAGVHSSEDSPEEFRPRRSARLKSMNSALCSDSALDQTFSREKRATLAGHYRATQNTQDGPRLRRSTRLRSIRSSCYGAQRPPRPRPGRRRRANVARPLDTG